MGEFAHRAEISHHLGRSYTQGDTNFEAQFCAARHELLYGDKNIGEALFASLTKARVDPALKRKVRSYVLDSDKRHKRYLGSVKAVNSGFCFVTSAELRSSVYVTDQQFSPADWAKLRDKDTVSFDLAFTMRGPCGTNAQRVTS
jgi:cold shock CspA family protein